CRTFLSEQTQRLAMTMTLPANSLHVDSTRRHWLLLMVIALSAVAAHAQATTSGSSVSVSAGVPLANSSASSQTSGSVPSGTRTSEVLRLTLRDAVARAVRYNQGSIESGENARNARGQRLLALSGLLPRVTASANEVVTKVSLVPSGISQTRILRIPDT